VTAEEWDQTTKLTFRDSVEVQGQVLPASTDWFKLADNDSDRNIIPMWNADRTHLVTTIPAIPDYRQNTPRKQSLIARRDRPASRKPFDRGFTPEITLARSLFIRRRALSNSQRIQGGLALDA
jgi:hypothetical protein